MSSRDICDLHPDLQPLCEKLLDQLKDAGIDARVIFTYRTPAEQNKIYAQGRTLPGKKVTNLQGSASKHCFTIGDKPAAKAFDLAIFDNGDYVENGDDPRYLQAGEMGEALGLTWGGRWHSPHDPSHFQIA